MKDSVRQKDRQRWERKEWASLVEKHPRHVRASPWGRQGGKQLIEGTDLLEFLSVNVGACILGRNVGPHLLKSQISRQHLVNPELLQTLPSKLELSNAFVVDLILFSRIIPHHGCQDAERYLRM